MTRIEFDNQVRSMKAARNAALNELATMTAEIKEEIAAKHRQIDDLHKEVCKLRQSAQGLHQRRIELETKWGARINKFIEENEPNTTSNLEEAGITNILYELRRRGFDGIVSRQNESGEYESYDIQKRFTQPAEE